VEVAPPWVLLLCRSRRRRCRGVSARRAPPEAVSPSVWTQHSTGKERKEKLRRAKKLASLGKMMLHFLLLARVVVGRLECDCYNSDTLCYPVDTDNCRAADMNVAFNEGEELLTRCNVDGWVRRR